VVIESTNQEVDTVNRLVQYERQARGEVRGRGVGVRANDEGRSWTLYEGDQVLVLETYRHDTFQRPLRNGTTGTVLVLEPNPDGARAVVRLDEGGLRVINVVAEANSQPLGLAYAVHANKFQGHEAKIVQVVPGPRALTTLESAYSTTSRATHEIHLYADRETHGPVPAESLALAWGAPAPKRTAHSRMAEAQLAAERSEPEQPAVELDWELVAEQWEHPETAKGFHERWNGQRQERQERQEHIIESNGRGLGD
jgi:hypothetical protein